VFIDICSYMCAVDPGIWERNVRGQTGVFSGLCHRRQFTGTSFSDHSL